MRQPWILICLLFAGCLTGPTRPPTSVQPDVQRTEPPPAEAPARPPPDTPPPAATAPSPPPEARPLTLVVGGDVTLGLHYEEYFDEQVSRGRSREEMFAYGFREVRPAVERAGADLFLVNLECPFTDRGEKLPKNFNFRARPEFVASLLAGGVDAVSLANNHLMDFGVVGLMDTISVLDQAKIPHFGAGLNLAEARRPAIIERNGIRLALLGYFFLGTRNIEPRAVIATDTTPGVAGHYDSEEAMLAMLREDIALAKTRADLVIPFFHWGKEGEHTPQPYQVRLAHAAVDAGAAAVLGSHPHVLQGMELYQGAPIIYSLGNFVFGGNWNPRKKESALYQARFSAAGHLSSGLIPLKTDRYPELPMQPYPLQGEEAETVLRNVAGFSAGFERMLPVLQPYAPGP